MPMLPHILHLPLPRYNLINQTFLIAFQLFYQLLLLCNQPVNLSALAIEIVSNFFLFFERRFKKWNLNKIGVAKVLTITDEITGSL